MGPEEMAKADMFGQGSLKDFFWLTPATAAVLSTVAPTATQNMQVDSDADFMWIASSYQIDIAGAALTEATNIIPLVTLAIVDTGTGKYLSNNPVPLAAYAGDGKRPYRLIRPRKFGASTTIQLNWANFVTAGTSYNVRFVMHGYKVTSRNY